MAQPSLLNMAQVRVNTTLQDDCAFDLPFTRPAPNVINEFAGVIYPQFTVGADHQNNLSIVFDTASSNTVPYSMYNIYWDNDGGGWIQENMNFPPLSGPQMKAPWRGSGIAMARNPLTSRNSFARILISLDAKALFFWFLNGDHRFPQWITTNISLTSSKFTNCDLDLTFNEEGVPTIYAVTSASVGYQWTGQAGSTPTLVSALSNGLLSTGEMKYGRYQDPSVEPDLSPVSGFYVTVRPEPNHWMTCARSTVGASDFTYVTGALYSSFEQVDVTFLANPSSAPLLVGTLGVSAAPEGPRVVFITNDSYTTPPREDNVIPIFMDVPSNRIAVWAKSVVTSGEVQNDGLFDVHIIAAFVNPEEQTMEIWHTGSIPSGIVEISDGIYSVPTGNWLSASLITTDVLSDKKYFFSGYAGQNWQAPFALTSINDTPVIVYTNSSLNIAIATRESETGSWTMEVLSSTPSSKLAPPQMYTTQSYYIDLTTVRSDGTPLGGVTGRIGSDSRMLMQINGESNWIDESSTLDISFGPDGRVGITTLANGLLIPPTFWLQIEDMDINTVIDIQPSADGLHDTFQNLGTPGNLPLAKIKKRNGDLLVDPNKVEPATTQAAQEGLIQLSRLITENHEQEPTVTGTIYKSTSKHVARVRPKDSVEERLDRLKCRKPTAFRIGFQNGLTFEHLTAQQVASHKAEVANFESSFFDSIGDFFEDVSNDVYEAVSCVVDAGTEFINGWITFIDDKVQKVWRFALEVASQVAELTLVVFDWISVAFNDLYDWLAWVFDWTDIQKTQQAFISSWASSASAVETHINTLFSYVTDGACQNALSQLDTIFSKAETNLGTSNSIITLTTPSAALLGQSPDMQDTVDSLPAAASWLLQKVQGIFDIDVSLPNAEGLKDFESEIETIMSSFTSDSTSSDASQAQEAFQNFFSTVVDRGFFDGTALQAMLTALKLVARFAIDLLKDIASVLSKMASYLIESVNSLFSQQVTSPIILGIYQYITTKSSCTMEDLCTLVLAVPYNLLYRVITGKSPNGMIAQADQATQVSVGAAHIALGVMTVVETVFATVQELDEALSGRLGFMNWIGLQAGKVKNAIMAIPSAALVPPTTLDTVLSVGDSISIIFTIVRVIYSGTSPNKKWIQKAGYFGKAVLGGISLGLTANQFANYNPEGSDMLLCVGAMIGSVRDITYTYDLISSLFKKAPTNPMDPEPVKPVNWVDIGVIITRAGAGIAQSVLYIIAGNQELQAENALKDAQLKASRHNVALEIQDRTTPSQEKTSVARTQSL